MMRRYELGPVLLAFALAVASLVAIMPAAHAAAERPVVRIGTGDVEGIATDAYRAFLGIPYAAPPTDDLRWRAPRPHAAWSIPLDASRFGNPCPQIPFGTSQVLGAEDCLFLNVYTPLTGNSQPVIVWIHGGGFVVGQGADVDGSLLAVRDRAVVVTLNYRLGPLGFLAYPDPDGATGDYGLQDQQLALRWVASNIRSFGGDPRKVTIFGQSAGGISVCDHLVSPTATGLFHRAIIESGPCTHPGAQLPLGVARQAGAAFALGFGCSDLACLRQKAASALLQAAPIEITPTGRGWTPSYGGALLPNAPAVALGQGQFNRVPVINGTNHDEGRFFALRLLLAGTPVSEASYTTLVQQAFGAAAGAVLAAYPVSNYATPSLAFAALVTDSAFACPARRADLLLSSAPVPTYAYEFNDPGAPAPVPAALRAAFLARIAPSFPNGLGAYHGAEIPYVFQAPFSGVVPAIDFTSGQLALSDRMIAYWSWFTRKGDPNHPRTPAWLPYTGATDSVLSFTVSRVAMISNFAADHKCAFWASFAI